MPTYAAPIYPIPTEHVLGAGTVTVPFGGIMTSRDYAVDMVSVPTANGVGQTVVKINSAVRGRHWVPQPFLSYLNTPEILDTILPDGFIGHLYELVELFSFVDTVAISDGALPPGLGLVTVGTTVSVTGTPTTLGTYDFTLRIGVGVVDTDWDFHVTILPDPDEGVGGMLT